MAPLSRRLAVYLGLGVPCGVLVGVPLILLSILGGGAEHPVLFANFLTVAISSAAALVATALWLIVISWECASTMWAMCICPWAQAEMYEPASGDEDVRAQSQCAEAWAGTGLRVASLPARWKIWWIVAFTLLIANGLGQALVWTLIGVHAI